ncbi:MAG TPA: hypothetical protein VH374_24230 [Polyangia bacterium]|jgi:hypothetical protein|nr:hypothetical protein [Polyangia bacterium]
MAKITTVYEPIDEKTRSKWNRRRWKADQIDKLSQGFSFRKRGRDGSIYFREGDHVLELIYEISGTSDQDILISADGLTKWIVPDGEPIAQNKQQQIADLLKDWLRGQATIAAIS